MNITLWVVQLLLAAVFAAAGTVKLTRPRLALAGRMPWVVDMSDGQVRGIGALEVLAAIGLVLPPVVHVATFLTPLAAVGAMCLMVGALATNVRIKEMQVVPVNVLLLALAAVVALARFGSYHF